MVIARGYLTASLVVVEQPPFEGPERLVLVRADQTTRSQLKLISMELFNNVSTAWSSVEPKWPVYAAGAVAAYGAARLVRIQKKTSFLLLQHCLTCIDMFLLKKSSSVDPHAKNKRI